MTNRDKQPEIPIDPPIDTEAPVDHLELAQVMLRDVEHELRQADLGKEWHRLLDTQIGVLQDMIEVLR